MNYNTVYVGMDVHKESFSLLKIAKFNSTIHLYGGILFCTSGI